MAEVLTSPVNDEQVQAALVMRAAGRQAMAEPVPGSVRDAVLQRTPIPVGDYSVRACEDGDIELLSLLEHPMNELRLQVAAMPDGDPEQRKQSFDAIWSKWVESHQYRGPHAWEICFLLTRPGEEADAIFEKGGLDAVRNAARREFRRLSPRAIMELTPVCITQYLRSWNTMLSYGSSEGDGENDLGLKKNSLDQTRSSTG
jgi:hypothetical protein